MKMQTVIHGKNTYTVFNIEVPVLHQPVITKEYFYHGVRMYKCANGKTYYADPFDAMFKVVKGAVKAKGYREKEITKILKTN